MLGENVDELGFDLVEVIGRTDLAALERLELV
jgi:hypothetical protein